MQLNVRLKVVAVFLTVALITTVAYIAYAVVSVSWHQNLQVPGSAVAVYRADGVTSIGEGSDQASIWMWDDVNMKFTATVNVKNVGTTIVGLSFVPSGLGVGWAFSVAGSLTGLVPDEVRSFALSATNPSASVGQWTGDFSIIVSVV